MNALARMAWGILCGGTLVAQGQNAELANPSFEEGAQAPTGWSLSQGKGEWAKTGGVDNGACAMVEGDGKGDNAWLSSPVAFVPGRAYRLSFSARADAAGGGTAVSGPSFANVDIGVPGKTWSSFEHIFATPSSPDGVKAPVRLGQWQMHGQLFFDNVRLAAVEPVYATSEGVVLGTGEKLTGNAYAFEALLGGESRNHSRPLLESTAHFNSDRWCFGSGSTVTYRHALNAHRLLSGSVEVSCGYYVAGSLTVEASNDGKNWQRIGALTRTGSATFALPSALFPADAVSVRLQGAGSSTDLQVNGYSYRGTVDGTPVSFEGRTHYIEETARDSRVKVRVVGLGEALPGKENVATLQVQNLTPAALTLQARVRFSQAGLPVRTQAVTATLPAGGKDTTVRVPYPIPGTGTWKMTVELGDAYSAQSSIFVPNFYDETYGELLPSKDSRLKLWRASSGWKIPQSRTPPQKKAKDLVIRTAKNEWEATQLVLTPSASLSNVTVRVSELAQGKDRLPAKNIEVLRVGYVPVEKPTDATGTADNWPDPLPPQIAPVHLTAGVNQPYWIRVKAPKDARAGTYRGTVSIEADGLKLSVPIGVEVYDFALPDTLSCATSFGFSPGTVWRYHNVTDATQRRLVLENYLATLSEHHISPYNPTPMESWSVSWKGLSPWSGGTIVTNEKVSGKGALFLRDASERENISASYQRKVDLPPKGFRVAFKFKADKPHPALFTLNYFRSDGSWMSGCNTDLPIDGKPEWQTCEKSVLAEFPKGAVACRFTVWAAGYQEPGVATGDLWVDDLSVTDLSTGKQVVEGGDFEPFDATKAEPVFDWAQWDEAMTRAFAIYHFNSFVIGVDGLGGGTFQERYEPSFLGYSESQPEYDVLFGKYLKGIEAHLREKGWLDKAYVYWFDEPDPKDYPFVMNGFAKLKKHAPGLRRMLTEQVEKELVGGPNLWVPLTPSLNVPGVEERRAAGDLFWWYVCCGPQAPYATEFIDHAGTDMRVWLWQTWAERVTGVLIWETVYWTSGTANPDPANPQNPYRDAMSWVGDGHLSPGTKTPWGNGDGRLIYPPEAAADGKPAAPVLDGPVDTIRLELLRDGLDDYEYFVILKRLLSEKASHLSEAKRARFETLLTVPKDVSQNLTHFTHDPAPIEAHRDKLARAIVELSRE